MSDHHTSEIRHSPVLPIWSCEGCGLPWPCPAERRRLHDQFADAPLTLALYLGSQFARASADLAWIPAERLHQRFLGWLR